MEKDQSLYIDVLNFIGDPVFVKDEQHRWIFGNNEFCAIIGLPLEKYLGKTDHDIFPKEMADMFHETDRQVFVSGIPNENEETILLPNGETRIILTKKTPLKRPDGKMVLVGVIRDITDRIETESRLMDAEKFSFIGEMAGGVSHEINNPLTIISSKLRTLMRDLLNGAELDREVLISVVNKVMATTNRISKIVEGIQSSYSGKTLAKEEVSTKSIIKEALSQCKDRIHETGIDLIVDEAADFIIEVNSTQISQVLLNLLSNAIDAVLLLPKNQRWIRVELKKNEKNRLIVAVTDGGTGIPKEIARKIMHPFFTTKEVGNGTGLGLYISKRLVEDNKGQFYLDQNSKNTSFVIDLPLK